MIINENSDIRLLTVMECKWRPRKCTVHPRPFGAISIRLKGDCVMREGDKTERLKTGDVLYMPEGREYFMDSGSERIFVLHFKASSGAGERMQVFRPSNTAAIHSMFSELYEVWKKRADGYYFRALSIFYSIVYELTRSAALPINHKHEKIREAVEYLHSAYTDPTLTVRSLAQRAYVSDTYFRKIFFDIYGKTPLSYLNDLRLSHAAAALCEGGSTVLETAHASGFADVKYFSTMFKRKMGVPPSKYRKTASHLPEDRGDTDDFARTAPDKYCPGIDNTYEI